MCDEKMESSSKADIDLAESNLSFISSLSSKDGESIIITDSMASDVYSQIDTNDLLKAGIMDSSEDLFDISFDKNSLSTDHHESMINNLASVNLQDNTDIDINIDMGQSEPCNNSLETIVNANIIETPVTEFDVNSMLQMPSDANLNIDLLQSSTSNLTSTAQSSFGVDVGQTAAPVLNSQIEANLTIADFPPSASLVKRTFDMSTLKKASTVSTSKSATQQYVILKSSSPSGSKNATIQTTRSLPAGSKIVTIPNLNTVSGDIISQSFLKANDIKLLLSQASVSSSPRLTTVQPQKQSVIPIKRPITATTQGQMFTKVIITNNTDASASAVPISTTSASQASGVSQLQIVQPPKTFTMPKNVINISPQVLKAVPRTPTKQQYILSPVKQPFKLSCPTIAKSPRKIAPANSTPFEAKPKVTTLLCQPTAQPMKLSSPSKVIFRTVQKMGPGSVNASSSIPSSVASSTNTSASQTVMVQGNKFHYIRLVSAPNNSATTATPSTSVIAIKSETETTAVKSIPTTTVKIAVPPRANKIPIAPAKLVQPRHVAPKLILSKAQLTDVANNALNQLTSGTLFSVGSNASYVIVPPQQYQTQVQPTTTVQANSTKLVNLLPAPTTNNIATSSQQNILAQPLNNHFNLHSLNPEFCDTTCLSPVSMLESDRQRALIAMDRQRKPCNCTKSQCLKLYCDCFANGEFCHSCNCNNCYNNLSHEEDRQKAIKQCLDRNPLAFHPKIGKSREGDHERRHTKGCNCKRSGCLKNYCECYEAKILCTNICKCIGCKNYEDNSERKTLMHLADAADMRVQQQAAARSNLPQQIFNMPIKPPLLSKTGEQLPYSFLSDTVTESTCHCLMSCAHNAESRRFSEEEIERKVLQEFSRSLKYIINFASNSKEEDN